MQNLSLGGPYPVIFGSLKIAQEYIKKNILLFKYVLVKISISRFMVMGGLEPPTAAL